MNRMDESERERVSAKEERETKNYETLQSLIENQANWFLSFHTIFYLFFFFFKKQFAEDNLMEMASLIEVY